jgi:hypothetical protein
MKRPGIVACLVLSGCSVGEADDLDDVVLDPPAEAPAWQPAAGATWQWQLTGTVDTRHEVEIYDVDLFDVPDALIDGLHAQGRRVLCYFSAGSWEDWRDDAGDFPEEALGRRLDGWPGERWLDVRHPDLRPVMEARLDRAVQRGCDGVEPDNVDGYSNSPGFELTGADQLTYNAWLAGAARERGLAVALKNDTAQVERLQPHFDLAVVEECHSYDECEAYLPFLDAGKPVLEAEYVDRETQASARADQVCPASDALGMSTLVLPWDLDGSFRVACAQR